MQKTLDINSKQNQLFLNFSGELTLYIVPELQNLINNINVAISQKIVVIDLTSVSYMDTASAIFILKIQENFNSQNIQTSILGGNKTINDTLEMVNVKKKMRIHEIEADKSQKSAFSKSMETVYDYIVGFKTFMEFFGKLFMSSLLYMKSIKNIRFKEIMFEINESGIKALGIISLTSFLIGLVVAYQSAYQLKIYGANIFIVDMLGISILRELAPIMTAIVIAGRSGSAFTAQIGAMKITQELDAMKAMGFNPYAFLVMPRVVALMIGMPILIFVSDIMGMLGGMIVAFTNLGITYEMFLDRFHEVIAAKHFFIGIIKGPFFAFLIASIAIYRGLGVKDDTQSIGFNTTKSVVESIFSVIICDAIFSIMLTNLGI